jgi:hypothetical protein
MFVVANHINHTTKREYMRNSCMKDKIASNKALTNPKRRQVEP